jgi:hypothetical protein
VTGAAASQRSLPKPMPASSAAQVLGSVAAADSGPGFFGRRYPNTVTFCQQKLPKLKSRSVQPDDDLELALRRADAAMYRAKQGANASLQDLDGGA